VALAVEVGVALEDVGERLHRLGVVGPLLGVERLEAPRLRHAARRVLRVFVARTVEGNDMLLEHLLDLLARLLRTLGLSLALWHCLLELGKLFLEGLNLFLGLHQLGGGLKVARLLTLQRRASLLLERHFGRHGNEVDLALAAATLERHDQLVARHAALHERLFACLGAVLGQAVLDRLHLVEAKEFGEHWVGRLGGIRIGRAVALAVEVGVLLEDVGDFVHGRLVLFRFRGVQRLERPRLWHTLRRLLRVFVARAIKLHLLLLQQRLHCLLCLFRRARALRQLRCLFHSALRRFRRLFHV